MINSKYPETIWYTLNCQSSTLKERFAPVRLAKAIFLPMDIKGNKAEEKWHLKERHTEAPQGITWPVDLPFEILPVQIK